MLVPFPPCFVSECDLFSDVTDLADRELPGLLPVSGLDPPSLTDTASETPMASGLPPLAEINSNTARSCWVSRGTQGVFGALLLPPPSPPSPPPPPPLPFLADDERPWCFRRGEASVGQLLSRTTRRAPERGRPRITINDKAIPTVRRCLEGTWRPGV